jgi:hypothetical protein
MRVFTCADEAGIRLGTIFLTVEGLYSGVRKQVSQHLPTAGRVAPSRKPGLGVLRTSQAIAV